MPSSLRMSRVSSSLFFRLLFIRGRECSCTGWFSCCYRCSLAVVGRALILLFVVCLFSSWLMIDAIMFAFLYPSLPYLMLVPCEIIMWSLSWGRSSLLVHFSSCSMVTISFSWCQMARSWSRYGMISLLFESAMRRHLGFVVVSIVTVSTSLSVCSSNLWNSGFVISSASFSFCFSVLISSCSSWGCCCWCCCAASSRSQLKLLMVVSFSAWVSIGSCMVFCSPSMSFSSLMLFWVVVCSVLLSVALLLMSFRFLISSCDFFC